MGSLIIKLCLNMQAIRPHMRSFLHTVQKNQMLMMTPNTLGRTGVIKSFIKHTTPLKIDPKVSCALHKISNRNIVQWASSITFRLLKMCLFTRHRDTYDRHECVYGGWSVLAVKFTVQIQKCLKTALEKRCVTEYKNSLSSSWKFALSGSIYEMCWKFGVCGEF